MVFIFVYCRVIHSRGDVKSSLPIAAAIGVAQDDGGDAIGQELNRGYIQGTGCLVQGHGRGQGDTGYKVIREARRATRQLVKRGIAAARIFN